MKKLLMVLFLLVIVSSVSFAADFVPTILTLTASAEIEYQFDGNELSVPFTVAGTPCAVWLVINTRGKGNEIGEVQNGFLGWHYVNKIDTTIYVSQKYSRTAGETSIVWDGNDQDGNAAAAGTYSYYLWGYDDVSTRVLACDFVQMASDWDGQLTHLNETGDDGLPLAKPQIRGTFWWYQVGTVFFEGGAQPHEVDEPWRAHGTQFKWELGSDPIDVTMLQTTRAMIYPNGDYDAVTEPGLFHGGPAFNPTDSNIFYHVAINQLSQTNTMHKYSWITSGEAVLDEDWLGWDEISWEDQGAVIGAWSQKPFSLIDGNYIFSSSPGLHQKELEWNRLRCVSLDGEVIFDKAMPDWYMPDDGNPHGYINGAFHLMYTRVPNHLMLASHTSCMHQMINTTRLVDDADDETDMVMFANSNGDYFLDSAYKPDLEPAWYCLADDKTTSPRRTSITIDSNNFNMFGLGYIGLSSLGVSTQDGTGVGHFQFADDTVSEDITEKNGLLCVDNGSNFDGLYPSGALTLEDPSYIANDETYFIAFDSVGGIITNEPGQTAVEEDAQSAFSVGQNSPNPFNPTTSISFTIADAGNVNVDIYNVAGQKIDTLVNDFMDAGKHSIVWDASGFSNGVYFYTVKSGDFSKTMKMTLLK